MPGDLAVVGGQVDVVVRDGRIVAVGAGVGAPDGLPVLDAGGHTVAPGYLDLQCNGGFGIDLASAPERLWDLAAALPATGVTAWLPTIVTSPPEVRERALAALRAGPPDEAPRAAPLGLHLEGPFLAPERRGAHPAALLASPAPAVAADWSGDAGVAMVTIAPELPGALELVRALVERRVVVAAGHSAATAREATVAVDAGVRVVTHVFNGMAPFHHRRPGLAGVALTDERLHVGLIADGVHVDPVAVAVAARAVGERLVLVTDMVAGPGRLADGTLAGSRVAMDAAVRNLWRFAGVTAEVAVAAATSAPARALGVHAERGVLTLGARGDLVVLDGDLGVVATVIAGVVVA